MTQTPAPFVAHPTKLTLKYERIQFSRIINNFEQYLAKYARLTNTNDDTYFDTWHTAVDTTMHTLLKVILRFLTQPGSLNLNREARLATGSFRLMWILLATFDTSGRI